MEIGSKDKFTRLNLCVADDSLARGFFDKTQLH